MSDKISTDDIQKLRSATGAGVMDVKAALVDAKGDADKAVTLLKERGLAKAAKKGERDAGEGIIHSYIHGHKRVGVLLELNCETDFVARNEEFVALAQDLCLHITAHAPETVEGDSEETALLAQPFVKDPDHTVEDILKSAITKLGENIKVARFERYELGMAKKYSRVLLKLSGEALADESGSGVSGKVLKALGRDIANVAESGVEVAVVVGAGNIWRYRDNTELPIERSASDQMGMLAGVINAVALQNAIEHTGVHCRVQSALTIPEVAEPYIRRRAIRHLEKGRVVIFAAGVGQPYFTHDTAGALRALEIGADVLLKGSNVDGVYDADPDQNPKAKRFANVSYGEVLTKDLKVMDATAISLCRENKLPIVVFDLFAKDALKKAVSGAKIGTTVTG